MNECKSPLDLSLSENVRDMASQCVKCGLCLPHCPTYKHTENENESPRGRIELLKALAEGALSPSAKIQTHLDHCLTCRACEKVCPAQVPYGYLMTQGRAMLIRHPQAHSSHSIAHRFFNYLATHPKQRTGLHWILWLLEKSGLRTIASILKVPKLIGLSKVNQSLPSVKKPMSLKSFYPARSAKKGAVGLFVGCIQPLADVDIHKASITILTALGYDVHIPQNQTCCGALFLHEGNLDKAQQLMRQNLSAFNLSTLDYIVSSATGCGTVLHEYAHHLLTHTPQENEGQFFTKKIVDVSTLVLNSSWPSNLKLKNFEKKIVVHTPCTSRHVWPSDDSVISLLKRIPKAMIHPLQSTDCCGAAGMYMIDFPNISKELITPILHELNTLEAHVIVTSNIGCALHLKQYLKQKKIPIQVMHPITLLSNLIFF